MDTTAYFYSRKRGEVILVFKFNQWAARNLAAKGFLNMHHILTRPMTADEVEELATAQRLYFRRYTGWAGLIEDELAVGVTGEVVDQLRQFSKNHPLKEDDQVSQKILNNNLN